MASALHVSCDFVEALVVIGGGAEQALAAARQHIVSVDPPSQGVPMRQVGMLPFPFVPCERPQ